MEGHSHHVQRSGDSTEFCRSVFPSTKTAAPSETDKSCLAARRTAQGKAAVFVFLAQWPPVLVTHKKDSDVDIELCMVHATRA